jgi:hypothetical protein
MSQYGPGYAAYWPVESRFERGANGQLRPRVMSRSMERNLDRRQGYLRNAEASATAGLVALSQGAGEGRGRGTGAGGGRGQGGGKRRNRKTKKASRKTKKSKSRRAYRG